jgi:SAM-dependent methyltransferase
MSVKASTRTKDGASLPQGFRWRDCPVCGPGAEAEVFVESNYDPARINSFSFASRKAPELMRYRLMRCRSCDVLYADPAPVLKKLSEAYVEASFDSGEEAAYAAKTYAGVIPRLGLAGRRGALDIGTGDGAFLRELLKAGFSQVQGIEPSQAPVKAAPAEIRKLIKLGFFKPGAYKAASLDLVTCFQTMEHVDAPAMVAKEAKRILRPGGAFYTVCHSHRSFSAKVLGLRSPIFDIEHLQLFSPRSLKRLLENEGYTGVQVFYLANSYPLHYWIKVFPLPGALKQALTALLRTLGIADLPIPLRAGNLAGFGIKPV